MSYREKSLWNDKNEIRCLLILKKLQVEGFPRAKQKEYWLEMAKVTNLTAGSISAKICNYKSLFGINNPSNCSTNTIKIYNSYKDYSIESLKNIYEELK